MESVFPYLKKRLKVINKSEVINSRLFFSCINVSKQTELSPIETNIEMAERKTVSIKAELSTATPNIKALQMALQGSLLTRKFLSTVGDLQQQCNTMIKLYY